MVAPRAITGLPAWLFTVTDPTIPDDCECHTFWHDNSSRLLLGPSFMSKSPEAYTQFANHEREEAGPFWRRVKRLEGADTQ